MGGDGSASGGRRRTDSDALWAGVPVPRSIPVPPGTDLGGRRPDVLRRPADDAGRRPPVRPVLAPEARAVRMPSRSPSPSSRPGDDVRAPGAARLPMPPVPPPAAPATSVAPFAAVPSPEWEPARGPVATVLDERPSAPQAGASAGPSRSAAVPSLPARSSVVGSAAPVVPRSPSLSGWADDDHDAPWMTGRGAVRAPRVPGRRDGAPFVERRASRLPADGIRPSTGPGEVPPYGDWTKPSGADRLAVAAPAPAPVPAPAPLTTAIPDREVAGRRRAGDDLGPGDRHEEPDHEDLGRREGMAGYRDVDGYGHVDGSGHVDGYGHVEGYRRVPGYADADPLAGSDRHDDVDRYDDVDSYEDVGRRGPTSSPALAASPGGRAASRAERQAREEARVAAAAARRRAAQLSGELPLDDDDERPRRPRRLLTGLVAVGAVAAAVLGVHSITTPEAEVAGAQSAATTSAPSRGATSAPAVTAALPPLDTSPDPVVPAAPVAPVRVPVTVLNATDVTGLAADISAAISGNGKGWRTGTPGGYPNADVAATTVYYTEGNEKQRQAALQLKEQFPQLSGPAVRFFEVPAEVQAPGLVVVAAGDWKP